MTFKIASSSADNERLKAEVLDLKKAMEGATAQVKEIAVKVIEGRGNATNEKILPIGRQE